MLVYIRKEALGDVLCQVEADSDVPMTLAQRFIDEREVENIKRKEKQELHLYMSVTVITDEQFDGHQGFFCDFILLILHDTLFRTRTTRS